MKIFLLIMISVIMVSCRFRKSEVSEPAEISFSDVVYEDKQKVKITVLKEGEFNKEILSNGKLYALNRSDLKFRTVGNIESICVKNGDKVEKGQVIARLDTFLLYNNLKQNRNRLDKAKIEIQDMLLGLGYNINDSARIPETTMRTVMIRSGFNEAKANLELAEYNLRSALLRAPIRGIVADLNLKESNIANQTDVFCTIIDNSLFEARFPVLENEFKSVKRGQKIRIIPYSDNNMAFQGEIVKINPRVDRDGMVSVGAICRNSDNELYEGMNVKIFIEESHPKELVVPKEAVVIRSEKQVVFKYSGGKAKWVYVKTGEENSSSVVITEGLQSGDSVISSGSLNLVHDSGVEIEN